MGAHAVRGGDGLPVMVLQVINVDAFLSFTWTANYAGNIGKPAIDDTRHQLGEVAGEIDPNSVSRPLELQGDSACAGHKEND